MVDPTTNASEDPVTAASDPVHENSVAPDESDGSFENDEPHQDEDADDHELGPNSIIMREMREHQEERNKTFLHELAQSPYYFASGFFLFGVMIQATLPFVNWHFIWFMFMQCVLLGVVAAGGAGVGLVAPLYIDNIAYIVNVFGIFAHRPKKMMLILRDDH